MKFVVVGDSHSDLHEKAVTNALQHLGHCVVEFSWHQYFQVKDKKDYVKSMIKKAQNKYLLGPIINRINSDLISLVEKEIPDVIFIYRGTHVSQNTLIKIKRISPQSILLGYNNDDPFSPLQRKYYWRHFIRALPYYDVVFAYREHNVTDYLANKALNSAVLRSWYISERMYPMELSEQDAALYNTDVVFIGHYESDGRLNYIKQILKNNINLKLFGPEKDWAFIANDDMLSSYYPIRSVWGKDYVKAIRGSKIALCFLSKLNRDTYTRRCFEIPATGTMMLAEYSDDLSSMFVEGKEVEFFRTKEELIDKIKHYLKNDSLREYIAYNGMLRVQRDGHDVISRMKQMLNYLQENGIIKN